MQATAAGRTRDAWLLGALALALYVMLGQNTLYNRDAHVLLARFAEGETVHGHHFTYFPTLRAVRALTAPLGLTSYQSARFASALGTALGVAFVHLANRRLGLSRGAAVLTTALVALCPAVAFFATVVEVHGPFFAAAGLAMFAAAAFAVDPRPRRALAMGLALGLASCAHATAHLMLAALLPVVWPRARRARPGPELTFVGCGALLALALAVQAVSAFTVPWLAGAHGGAESISPGQWLELNVGGLLAQPHWLAGLPALVAAEVRKEWLVPMAPLSVAFLIGLRARDQRRDVLLMLLGLLPYVVLIVALLWPFPPYSERGAYLLPLVWPAALLARAALPRTLVLATIALSAGLAIAQIEAHDEPERSAEYAAGVRAVAGASRPYLLLGDYRDFEALHIRLPDVEYAFLTDWVGRVPLAQQPALAARIDDEIDRRLRAGFAVLFTAGTESVLADPGVAAATPAPAALLAHLRAQWRLDPVENAGFRGWRVLAR